MLVPGSANPLLLRSAAAAGYSISRSLRFNSSDSAYLSRTPASAGNRKTWTWAGWVKRSDIGSSSRDILFSNDSGSYSDTSIFQLGFYDNQFLIYGYLTNFLVTTAVYRDPSAYYHVVVSLDTTQATASNRLKLYINGSEVTTFSTDGRSSITQNGDYGINQAVSHSIGRQAAATTHYFDGYLADIYFIDGQALTPSSFTETDATTGQLVPKAYTGSYGTNGFHLEFADNSAATATTLGKDTSGNGNNWTPNNFQATVQTGRLYAQASGTSTSAFSSATLLGNFPTSITASYAIYDADLVTPVTSATFSYLYSFSSVVEVLVSADGTNWTSKGNQSSSYTTVSHTSAFRYVRWFYSTFAFGITNNPAQNDSLVDVPTNGSQTDTGVGGEVRGNYCTLNPIAAGFGSNNQAGTLANGNLDWTTSSSTYFANTVSTFAVRSGKYYVETICQNTSYSGIGFVNATSIGSITGNYGLGAPSDGWFRQGTLVNNNSSNAVTGMSALAVGDVVGLALDLDNGKAWWSRNGTWHNSGDPAAGTNATVTFTLGGKDWLIGLSLISPSAAQAINFGQRAFAYTAPSGFKALCTANLPAPSVTKPNTVMDVLLYTGNGGSQTVSGLGFAPDFLWIKSRSTSQDPQIFDEVRGVPGNYYALQTNSTAGEGQYGTLSAITSNGFTLPIGGGATNFLNTTYAAWCWDAGSSTVTNTAGSITSSVRANASAGFSIVTYTGNGTAGATVGHGLGVAPALIINKQRSGTNNWWTYHASLGATKYLVLDLANAAATANTTWNDTAPTSTVFSIGVTGVTNTSSATYVSYCFAPVAGYSAFGSYTGNGSGSPDGPFIYTGFRPRWILFKNASTTNGWRIMDTSINPYNVVSTGLYPYLSNAEDSATNWQVDYLSNGFKVRSNSGQAEINGSGNTIIYAAFAESPFNYSRAR